MGAVDVEPEEGLPFDHRAMVVYNIEGTLEQLGTKRATAVRLRKSSEIDEFNHIAEVYAKEINAALARGGVGAAEVDCR